MSRYSSSQDRFAWVCQWVHFKNHFPHSKTICKHAYLSHNIVSVIDYYTGCAIIVTDNYLSYKEPKKVLTTFFLFWYLTNYLRLKLRTNGNIERQGALLSTGGKSNCLRVAQIPLLSLQCCRDFQSRKLACKAIWFYVNYIEHIVFLKIILRPCKINQLM